MSHPNITIRVRFDSTVTQLTRVIALDSSFGAAWALRAHERSQSAFFLDGGASVVDPSEVDTTHALALDSSGACKRGQWRRGSDHNPPGDAALLRAPR